MTRESHVVVGCITSLSLMLNQDVGFVSAVIGLSGSITPDLDFKLGMKHRGLSHSILMVVVSYLIIDSINKELAFVFSMNYLMHIVADSFTSRGVPILFPLIKKKIGLKLFKNNSKTETIIRAMLKLVIVYLISRLVTKYLF